MVDGDEQPLRSIVPSDAIDEQRAQHRAMLDIERGLRPGARVRQRTRSVDVASQRQPIEPVVVSR
jgi:hypothetical protein